MEISIFFRVLNIVRRLGLGAYRDRELPIIVRVCNLITFPIVLRVIHLWRVIGLSTGFRDRELSIIVRVLHLWLMIGLGTGFRDRELSIIVRVFRLWSLLGLGIGFRDRELSIIVRVIRL